MLMETAVSMLFKRSEQNSLMLASMLLRETQTNTPNLEERLKNSGNTTDLGSTWTQHYFNLTCHNSVEMDLHCGDWPAPRGLTCTVGTDLHREDRPAPWGLTCTVRPDLHRGDWPAPWGPTCTVGTDLHHGDRPAPRGLNCTEGTDLHRGDWTAPRGPTCTLETDLHRGDWNLMF